MLESPLHYFKEKESGYSESVRGRTDGDNNNGIVIKESALLGHLILRGDSTDESFVDSIGNFAPLPVEPCTCNVNNNRAIYWLGPDEWLLLVELDQVKSVENELRKTLTGHISIVDVSGGQTQINISGTGVGTVLQKSSGYDFHPRNFPAGRCVQTTLAKATAMVSKRDNGSFDLVIRRSFADYIAQWLLDAGREFGCRIELL